MANSVVTVASYRALGVALGDWDQMMSVCPDDHGELIDAALVESDVDTVRVFHRHATSAPGNGSIASAVIGLLQPTSIVTGAVAGGVGGHVLTTLRSGICRAEMLRLGEAFDAGPIAFVTITVSAPDELFRRADSRVATEVEVDLGTLEKAARQDALG